jgi:hypothetical protein
MTGFYHVTDRENMNAKGGAVREHKREIRQRGTLNYKAPDFGNDLAPVI